VKAAIIEALQRTEQLLTECGWDDRAEWFRLRRARIEAAVEDSDEYKAVLQEINSILVGMGSFSDVPMYRKEGSTLTRDVARQQQWDLTAALGDLVRNVIALSGDTRSSRNPG
jgi:hypothetical protein